MQLKCAVGGSKKSRFMKEQEAKDYQVVQFVKLH